MILYSSLLFWATLYMQRHCHWTLKGVSYGSCHSFYRLGCVSKNELMADVVRSLVVTLAMLLCLINCRFITIIM